MKEELLKKLSELDDGESFYVICSEIFFPETKNVKAKDLARELGITDSLLSKIRGVLKGKNYSISQDNFKTICQAISRKTDVNNEEIKNALSSFLIIFRPSKASDTSTITDKNIQKNIDLQNNNLNDSFQRLKKEITFIIEKMGYNWVEDSPEKVDSWFLIGKVTHEMFSPIKKYAKKNPSTKYRLSIFLFKHVAGLEITQSNYSEVLKRVSNWNPRFNGLIILCCDDESLFNELKFGNAFKIKNNIWIKRYGMENCPYLKSSYSKESKKEMKYMLKDLKKMSVQEQF